MSSKNKQYIIRKYVMAKSIKDALKKEKEVVADDCWVNDEWIKNNAECNEIGFK